MQIPHISGFEYRGELLDEFDIRGNGKTKYKNSKEDMEDWTMEEWQCADDVGQR